MVLIKESSDDDIGIMKAVPSYYEEKKKKREETALL